MTEKEFSVDAARKITANEMYGRIKTREGHPVRIVCWDAKGQKPIVGLVEIGVVEYPIKYTADGKADTRENVTTNTDLVVETEGGEA